MRDSAGWWPLANLLAKCNGCIKGLGHLRSRFDSCRFDQIYYELVVLAQGSLPNAVRIRKYPWKGESASKLIQVHFIIPTGLAR